MAFHRASSIRLGWAVSAALLLCTGAFAQTEPANTTTTSTSSTMGTMQPVAGKNLLWLSSPTATCPTGYTLTTVKTPTGPKKACAANGTQAATSSSMQSTSTDTTPQ
jgi:hypothetical protein